MTENSAAKSVDIGTVRRWLGDAGEVAFLDVREDGQHGAGHPLLAVNAPYSRLEIVIGQLAPRRGCPVVLLDDGDGVAEKAARRLAALGYSAIHALSGGVGAWAAARQPPFPSTNVPSKALAETREHQLGTQAWRLAGIDLEHGATTSLKAASPQALAAARKRAETVAARFGIRHIDQATLAAWHAKPERTTFVLDVRTPDEFAAGHLPGSVSAPGGQLVQAIDRWVGVRGARLVLVDDTLARAVITAQWLQQMGDRK